MDKIIKLLDVVCLIEDIPEFALQAGEIGTVVEIINNEVFEVEFCDRDSTYSIHFSKLKNR